MQTVLFRVTVYQSLSIVRIIATHIGIIMAVAAVLLIHMEISATTPPLAINSIVGLLPTPLMEKMYMANLRSSLCRVMALAMIKLPMKRKTIGSANGASTVLAGATFMKTHSAAPTSAVTGIGMASDIHQVMTRPRIAASMCPWPERDVAGIKYMRMKISGPAKSPMVCLHHSNLSSCGEKLC